MILHHGLRYLIYKKIKVLESFIKSNEWKFFLKSFKKSDGGLFLSPCYAATSIAWKFFSAQWAHQNI